MPPFVIPDTLQARMLWNFQGQLRAINVLHYAKGPTTVDADTAVAFRNHVITSFTGSNWDDEVGNTWSLNGVDVRDISAPNLPAYTSVAGNAGLNSGQPLPAQNAMCITLRTAMAGKSYRGRVYLAGLTENANGATGAINTVTRNRGADFVQSLMSWSQSPFAPALMVVASPTLGIRTPVTQAESRDNRWDTQRRRSTPVDIP